MRLAGSGVGCRGVVFAGGAVAAVVDAIRVERSIEVAMGFGDWGVCAEAGCAQREGQFAGGLVGGINSVSFHCLAPRFGQVIVDGGELSCGDGADQCGDELSVGAIDGDRCGVA